MLEESEPESREVVIAALRPLELLRAATAASSGPTGALPEEGLVEDELEPA
jgi:hypothetical protein